MAHAAALAIAVDSLRSDNRAAAEAALAGAFGAAPAGGWLAATEALAARAQALVEAMDWIAAHRVYEILVQLGHRYFDWHRERLAWRARNQDAFRAQFEAQDPILRLRPFLEEKLGRPISSITTKALKPGYVGMAIYRHRIRFADGDDRLVIIEKVMSDECRDTRRVDAERLLFTIVPPASLLAPPYHGVLPMGSFVSTFQGFSPGAPLPIADWAETYAALLYRYWSVVPSERLTGGPRLAKVYLDRVREVIEKKLPEQVPHYLRTTAIDDAALVLSRSFSSIEERVARMPIFVFHDDLHCGNILVDEAGAMSIIDWDNWALAPIGSGWMFYAMDDPDPIDMERLRAARALPEAVTAEDLMLMAALWGWHKALRDAKYDLAARWLERLCLLV